MLAAFYLLTLNMTEQTNILASYSRDFYLSSLFCPADKRENVQAIWSFSAELANIVSRINEPMAGEIRLQWWLEALSDQRVDEAQSSPGAKRLLDIMATYKLPASGFEAMIEARIFELYHDPLADWQSLEVYLGGLYAAPMQMAAVILNDGRQPSTSDFAGFGAMAYGICHILQAMPQQLSQGRVRLPQSLLDQHGLNAASLLSDKNSDGAGQALDIMLNTASDYLAKARGQARGVPNACLPAFLPISNTAPWLKKLVKNKDKILREPQAISPLRSQWQIWRMAKTGRL